MGIANSGRNGLASNFNPRQDNHHEARPVAAFDLYSQKEAALFLKNLKSKKLFIWREWSTGRTEVSQPIAVF